MRTFITCSIVLVFLVQYAYLSAEDKTKSFSKISITKKSCKMYPVAAACRLLSAILPPLENVAFPDGNNEMGKAVFSVVSDIQRGTSIDASRIDNIVSMIGNSEETDTRSRALYAYSVLRASLDEALSVFKLNDSSLQVNETIISDLEMIYPKSEVLPIQQRKLFKLDNNPLQLTIARREYVETNVKLVIPVDKKRYRLKAIMVQHFADWLDELFIVTVNGDEMLASSCQSYHEMDFEDATRNPVKYFPLIAVYELDEKYVKSANNLTTKPPSMIRNLPELGENEFLRGPLSALAMALVNLPVDSDNTLVTILNQMRNRDIIDLVSLYKLMMEESTSLMEHLLHSLPQDYVEENISTFSSTIGKECKFCGTEAEEPTTSSFVFLLPNGHHKTLSQALQDSLLFVNESQQVEWCDICNASTTQSKADTITCQLKRFLFIRHNGPFYLWSISVPTDGLNVCGRYYEKLVAFVEVEAESKSVAYVRLSGGKEWVRIAGDGKMVIVRVDDHFFTNSKSIERTLIYRRD